MAVELKNPHSVLAAIQLRPLDVLDIQVATDAPSPAWSEVIDVARAHAVRVTRGGRPSSRDRRGGEKEGRETGMSAIVRERPDVPLEELFANAATRADGHGLWLCSTIYKTRTTSVRSFAPRPSSDCRGSSSRKTDPPLSGVAYDVAAGGLEHVPFTIVPNLALRRRSCQRIGLVGARHI